MRLSILTIEKDHILLDYYISISEQQQKMKGVTRKQEEDRIQKRENGQQSDLQKERTSQAVQTYSSDSDTSK